MSSSSNDLYGMLPEVRKTYTKDIESEVYTHFKAMFASSVSASDLIELMRKWKESSSDRDHQLFDCIMRNVYEEHQWLHQYPDKAFEITARFFGMLIDNGFLSYMGLGIALRQLIDFLRMGPSQRHFHFAIFAMDMFKERLHEYSQFCHHVTQTPYFKDFSSLLKDFVLSGTKAEKPAQLQQQQSVPVPRPDGNRQGLVPVRGKGQVVSPTPQGNVHGGGSDSEESDTEDLPLVTPPESVRDKLGFLFNNISMANVKDKTAEFKELLQGDDGEKYTRWVADYIVKKRAGQETNFHQLYHSFVQLIEMPRLYAFIVRETVHSIKGLLRTEKSVDNFSERTLLKNLGSWLGWMTIAMNRPIRAKDLDMKALIVESYHKGQNELNCALPLVTKILCLCVKSKIFGKQNPWIRTILSLLGAVHAEPDTKLNLKFEVEVLAKALELNVSDLGESQLLKNEDYVRWVMQFGQQLFGAQPKRGKQLPVPPDVRREPEQRPSQMQGIISMPIQQTPIQPMPPVEPGPTPSGFRFHYKDLHPPQFQSTFTRIVFNQEVSILQADMSIRNALRIAVERTLQEFLMPCVERCMRIVVPAALVIARKDFCLDADVERMKSAAIVMVRHLASGLSFATMRAHLYDALVSGARMQILSHLTSPRATLTEDQQTIVTKACEIFAKDNLELCSAFLQKAASERCIMEIKNTLTEEVSDFSFPGGKELCFYDTDFSGETKS